MRVHHELVTMPIFFGGQDSRGRLHYRATAFLVGYPTPRDLRVGAIALVTARHNVLRAVEDYGNVWIRLNTKDGAAQDVEVTAAWEYPDDPALDVAAVPFYPSVSGWESLPCPTSWFLTDEVIASRGVGPGDDLVVMGLFSAHVGTKRNLPIVRSGNIASMPLEPLMDENSGCEFTAYLAEVRSIGGLSGSPVFVVINPATRLHAGDMGHRAGMSHYFLLGLIRGHWRQDAHALDSADVDYSDPDARQLNTGIAMVTPATELLPLFEREVFVDLGKQMDEARDRASPR